MDEMKLMRARAAAMSSIGVLLHHDQAALLHILAWVKNHLLEDEARANEAMLMSYAVIRKARYGKA